VDTKSSNRYYQTNKNTWSWWECRPSRKRCTLEWLSWHGRHTPIVWTRSRPFTCAAR